MHPRLFSIDLSWLGISWAGIDIVPFPSYFALLTTGFLLATVMGALWARRIGQNPDVIVDLGLAMLIAGVAGARILHVLADGYFWDYVHLCTDPSLVDWHLTQAECGSAQYNGVWDAARSVCKPPGRDCFAWARFYAGGLTYYGGFMGASLAAWFQLRADKFPFWRAADMAGMVVPLGLGFGRMGCLLSGCCFGVTTSQSVGLSFPPHSPASEAQFKSGLLANMNQASLPVHPTQLYESFAALAIASFLILRLHGKKRYDGQVFLAFVALYAGARFLLEFLRSDDRGGFGPFSTSQWIGVLLVAAAVYFHKQRVSRVANLAIPAKVC